MKSPFLTPGGGMLFAVLAAPLLHAQDFQGTSSIPKELTLTAAERQELGITLEIAEMRELPGSDGPVIVVPIDSVLEDGGKTYVVAQDENDEDRFEVWEVTLGVNDDEFIEALTGVFPGDNLVVKRNAPDTRPTAQIDAGDAEETIPSPADIGAKSVREFRPIPPPTIATGTPEARAVVDDGACENGRCELVREPAVFEAEPIMVVRERIHRRAFPIRNTARSRGCDLRRVPFRGWFQRRCRTGFGY